MMLAYLTNFSAAVITLAVQSGDPLVDFLANNATGVAVMAYVIVALQRGWLVTGRENTRCVEDLDRAMTLVYQMAEANDRALDVAEKVKS